jgi:adenylate cyclase
VRLLGSWSSTKGLLGLYRPVTLVACALIGGLTSGSVTPSARLGNGFLYDVALRVISALAPDDPEASNVVVVAIDDRSLADEALEALPRAMFAPYFEELVEGLVASGARTIGFDIIFAWSGNRLAAAQKGIDPNYDRSFLATLGKHRGKIVLARSNGTDVAKPYFYSVSGIRNPDPAALGFAEKFPDDDGIYRRSRLALSLTDGTPVLSLAGAVVKRAGPDRFLPSVMLAPRHHLESIPTYAFVDVLRCARDDPASLARAFSGKVVFVGTTLAAEDRLKPTTRFLPEPEVPANPGGCPLKRTPVTFPGEDVAGVFFQAATASAALSGQSVTTVSPSFRAVFGGTAALFAATAGLTLQPWTAAVTLFALIALLFGAETAALTHYLWVPAAVPMAIAAGAMVASYLVRFLVEERRQRFIRRSFGRYLSPVIVAGLAEGEEPRLGGELRQVTIMFADLSGFTALSGKVGPEELMAVTNRYLGLITKAVDDTGGYVDKFIGDAVMGIWGAPVADEHHSASATRAALAAIRAVDAARAEDEAKGAHGYSVKIGLNTGPAVVGNVGTPGRLGYTAVGETVNISARLESVPGDYGCRIVVGPATARDAAATILFAELDWLKVKGKAEPISVYDVLGLLDEVGEAERSYAAGYAAALAHYRARRFAEAAAAWRALPYPGPLTPGKSPPPLVMAERAENLIAEPPDADWDGVWVKTSK